MNLNKLDKMNAECKLRHKALPGVETSIPQVKSIFDRPRRKAGRPKKMKPPREIDWEKIRKWATLKNTG